MGRMEPAGGSCPTCTSAESTAGRCNFIRAMSLLRAGTRVRGAAGEGMASPVPHGPRSPAGRAEAEPLGVHEDVIGVHRDVLLVALAGAHVVLAQHHLVRAGFAARKAGRSAGAALPQHPSSIRDPFKQPNVLPCTLNHLLAPLYAPNLHPNSPLCTLNPISSAPPHAPSLLPNSIPAFSASSLHPSCTARHLCIHFALFTPSMHSFHACGNPPSP